MRDFVLLFVNGCRHEIRGDAAFLPLSDYVRCHCRLTGTKIVCSEGDCGACAVLLGTPALNADRVDYRPITSCIAMVFQLDGAHIITVEGLAKATRSADHMHPVQHAMVACNGAQCGFCTPGFVVSLAGMCEKTASKAAIPEGSLRLGLTGNLCRCTGYEQILDAARSINRADLLPLNEVYPPAEMLPAMRDASATPFQIQTPNKLLYKPTDIPSACKFKQQNPGCTIIAGGTDIGVLINKGKIDPTVLMSVGGLKDSAGIEETDTHLTVGMLATLASFEAAIQTAIPELHQIMIRHGSPLIRNAGTLAGNIVNGSPIGDTMPALMVLNAEVELTGLSGSRRVSMNAFYTGYRKNVLAPDELLTRIIIPKPKQDEILRLYKVSKRWDLDISTFTAAFLLGIKKSAPTNGNGNGHDNLIIAEARVAYGGVGPVILRLPKTEAFLQNKSLSEELMIESGEIACQEIVPISDVRSSGEYRSQLAQNIPLKLFYELGTSADSVH
ncbi:MAG TPA: FAD binding domain-containing protein [Phycisphaerae bacterium]|nr:FAD binding domain-containing protein [Phycisphaerae bacterium]